MSFSRTASSRTLLRRPGVAIAALSLALIPLAGCGSDKKAADTTVAAADSTAAPDTTAAPETTAAPDTTAAEAAPDTAAADTTVAPDSTAVATADTNPAAGEPPADTASAADGAVSDEQLKAALGAFGISTDEQLKCVKDIAGDSLNNLGGSAPPVKFIKALLKCAPDALATASAPAIKKSIPDATDEQVACLAKATFKVLSDLDDATLETAFSAGDMKNLPDTVKAKATAAAKGCGLSDAQLAKALSSSKA